ncbi:hypothetical protein DFA_00792 [Cavenderia fasciculata]|uniref:Uncharacterized protein n=1 Tax=Cavenderia fasciculata TaxID=261658 RepID=F4PTU6_CACFS|nr:uncharacterized protein DFA_00792 [Cavenderia fasciculata]EGG20925.1 hypothetical protein DFA_00792 [Cavenderia fasciculata]|eukprot:XP_004358775.1 hypothetical protein DFA_00792 [Cavenderia fasciculata]
MSTLSSPVVISTKSTTTTKLEPEFNFNHGHHYPPLSPDIRVNNDNQDDNDNTEFDDIQLEPIDTTPPSTIPAVTGTIRYQPSIEMVDEDFGTRDYNHNNSNNNIRIEERYLNSPLPNHPNHQNNNQNTTTIDIPQLNINTTTTIVPTTTTTTTTNQIDEQQQLELNYEFQRELIDSTSICSNFTNWNILYLLFGCVVIVNTVILFSVGFLSENQSIIFSGIILCPIGFLAINHSIHLAYRRSRRVYNRLLTEHRRRQREAAEGQAPPVDPSTLPSKLEVLTIGIQCSPTPFPSISHHHHHHNEDDDNNNTHHQYQYHHHRLSIDMDKYDITSFQNNNNNNNKKKKTTMNEISTNNNNNNINNNNRDNNNNNNDDTTSTGSVMTLPTSSIHSLDGYFNYLIQLYREKFLKDQVIFNWDERINDSTYNQSLNTLDGYIKVQDYRSFTRHCTAFIQSATYCNSLLVDLLMRTPDPIVPKDQKSLWIYSFHDDNNIELLADRIAVLPMANMDILIRLFGLLHDISTNQSQSNNNNINNNSNGLSPTTTTNTTTIIDAKIIGDVYGATLLRSESTPNSSPSASLQGSGEFFFVDGVNAYTVIGTQIATLFIEQYNQIFPTLNNELKQREERVNKAVQALKENVESHYCKLQENIYLTIKKIKPSRFDTRISIIRKIHKDTEYQSFVDALKQYKVGQNGRVSLKKDENKKRTAIDPLLFSTG